MSYWKYKNLSIFAYNEDNTAGKAENNRQAVEDWKRWVAAVECPILIDGKSLSNIFFEDDQQLKNFFIDHLFAKVKDRKKKDELADKALLHFHQGGLPFATQYILDRDNPRTLGEPRTQINFIPTEDGVRLEIEATYENIRNPNTGNPVYKPREEFGYFAKTNTIILFAEETKLLDLKIDCPDRRVSYLFDRRDLVERFRLYIKKLLIDMKFIEESSPKEDDSSEISIKI